MAQAKPLHLPPFHLRVIADMAPIHKDLKGSTGRALDCIYDIGRTGVGREHVPAVRCAMNKMLNRLGGANNPRRFKQEDRALIAKANRALDQQEQADAPGAANAHAAEYMASNEPFSPAAVPEGAEAPPRA